MRIKEDVFVFSAVVIWKWLFSCKHAASNEDGQIISDASHTGLVKGLVKDLTSNQMKLLELIETHPNVTKEEMAKHIGISTTAIDNNINTLKAKGLLERVGGRKDGYWKIVKLAHQ